MDALRFCVGGAGMVQMSAAIPKDILDMAAATVEAIQEECFREKLFLGTVNARAVIRDYLAREILAERERCAVICDKEVAAMQRVADFHRPPRVDYDPALADMHDQGATVAFKLAAAIRQEDKP
ncbi:hypothetical protein EN816_00955 [Mesorhizobium sp. M8A.F.Ca.ET.173.01.1.1]|nr:hypothetical protein EN816_00955 [Mesorhizobium sp. M8A.F.Ca.ET.173.01.1.1]